MRHTFWYIHRTFDIQFARIHELATISVGWFKTLSSVAVVQKPYFSI
jgi:hypothetical protein